MTEPKWLWIYNTEYFGLGVNADHAELTVRLPEAEIQQEIIREAHFQIDHLLEVAGSCLHGIPLTITGRCTTSLACYLGHAFLSICKSVRAYAHCFQDPSEEEKRNERQDR